MGNYTAFTDFNYLFMSVMCCYCTHYCCNASAVSAAAVINLFNFTAKFFYLVSVVEGILDVL